MAKAKPLTADDRFAIQDLFARYAWALDTGHVDDLALCFTEDAVIIEEVFEEPDRWEGRDGVRALGRHFMSAPNFPGRQHHVDQLQVEGNTKKCKSRSFAFVTECQGEPPYVVRFAGYYEDKLVKVDGEWLFKKRIIRLWDGPILGAFPGKGNYVPRKRPAELQVKSRK